MIERRWIQKGYRIFFAIASLVQPLEHIFLIAECRQQDNRNMGGFNVRENRTEGSLFFEKTQIIFLTVQRD